MDRAKGPCTSFPDPTPLPPPQPPGNYFAERGPSHPCSFPCAQRRVPKEYTVLQAMLP